LRRLLYSKIPTVTYHQQLSDLNHQRHCLLHWLLVFHRSSTREKHTDQSSDHFVREWSFPTIQSVGPFAGYEDCFSDENGTHQQRGKFKGTQSHDQSRSQYPLESGKHVKVLANAEGHELVLEGAEPARVLAETKDVHYHQQCEQRSDGQSDEVVCFGKELLCVDC